MYSGKYSKNASQNTGGEVTVADQMKLLRDRGLTDQEAYEAMVLYHMIEELCFRNAQEANKIGLDPWHTCIEFGYWVEN